MRSVRQAAAASGVSPFVVRRWISQGMLDEPPWTLDEVQEARDTEHRGPRSQAAHGSTARWNAGCSCANCRTAHSDDARVRKRVRAQARLPAYVRQRLLAAIYAGQPSRAALRNLGLTSNQVFGLSKTDEDWSTALEAAGARSVAATAWQDTRLVSTTRYGTPIEPRNFQRSWELRCTQAGVRPITTTPDGPAPRSSRTWTCIPGT